MARRGLPAAFATITKIIPPGLRRAALDPDDREHQRKVVFGDYYAALAGVGMAGSMRARPWPIERAVYEGYSRIIWVGKSVDTIAGQASRLKFVLKQDEDEVDDHPLLNLLNTRANPLETGRQFRSRLGKQILLSKTGACVEVTKARNGTPLRMDLLPPGRTFPVPGTAVDPDDPSGGIKLIDHWETVRADGTRAFIDAENVLWFREPHPTDPYSGVTPLESAGMSVELDFFARLYNTTFMKNDARPGGIVGVDGEMDDEDIEALERKFGSGPAEAGKLTVIAGKVSYVDSVARPRDAQHGETSDRAKVEILDAFGVPESMFGNTSGRTYDNAGQEGYNFWLITMEPFLDLQVTGFDELSEPELEGFFDVSHVPALAAAEAAKREEARSEFAAGLISIDQYLEATGKDPHDLPATRALIIAGGTTMVPTSLADIKALGGPLVPLGQAAAPPGGQQEPGTPAQPAVNGSTAHPLPGHHDTGPAAAESGDKPGDTTKPDNGSSGSPGSDAPATKAVTPPRPRQLPAPVRDRPQLPAPVRQRPARAISGIQVKAAPRSSQTAPSDNGDSDSRDDTDPDRDAADQQAEQLETELGAALAALAATWAASRLMPDAARWAGDARAVAGPLIAAAAWTAASRAQRATGYQPSPAGPSGDDTVSGTSPAAASARASSSTVTEMVAEAAAALAAHLSEAVASGEAVGIARKTAVWARGVTVNAATAVINLAADAAASIACAILGRPLTRVWRTRRDERVRDTHVKAEGQRQKPGEPFRVGDALLMYPGDPTGPPEEVRNCRCRLSHRLSRAPLFGQEA